MCRARDSEKWLREERHLLFCYIGCTHFVSFELKRTIRWARGPIEKDCNCAEDSQRQKERKRSGEGQKKGKLPSSAKRCSIRRIQNDQSC